MIAQRTVLILGAGASMPFGFPSGRSLLTTVCRGLAQGNILSNQLQEIGHRSLDIKRFCDSLGRSAQPSIDALLETRPEFLELGKDAIAISLSRYENEDKLFDISKQSWYELLFNRMSCQFDEFGSNPISFVTFNYDRSLEHFLFTALQHKHGVSDADAAWQVSRIPIVHVHGQIGVLPWQKNPNSSTSIPYTTTNDAFQCHLAARSIRVLSEQTDDSEELVRANEQISHAKIVSFLGFGYHPTNMRRLRIAPGQQRVGGTCYGLKEAEVARVTGRYKVSLHSVAEDIEQYLLGAVNPLIAE